MNGTMPARPAVAVSTNPTLSRMRCGCLSREIARAEAPEALRAAAQKRIPYLIGADRTRLREEYIARLKTLNGAS